MLRLMDSENVDSGGDQIPASWSGDTLWGQTDNMFYANDNRYILHYIRRTMHRGGGGGAVRDRSGDTVQSHFIICHGMVITHSEVGPRFGLDCTWSVCYSYVCSLGR